MHRENKRLARALKEARLKLGLATIEAIDYPPRRELDRAVIRQLATCRWVEDHHNVLVTGATGVGKTYVACALAHHACRPGFRAAYRRASRLFSELALARADGTYPRVLARLARIDVLVIDDWGLTASKDPERQDLLEILDDRHEMRSTIITSQLPPNQIRQNRKRKPASLRSDHDPRSERSRWSDPRVHDDRNTHRTGCAGRGSGCGGRILTTRSTTGANFPPHVAQKTKRSAVQLLHQHPLTPAASTNALGYYRVGVARLGASHRLCWTNYMPPHSTPGCNL